MNRLPFQPGARVLILAKFAALGSRGTVVRAYQSGVAVRLDGWTGDPLFFGLQAVVELEEPPPPHPRRPLYLVMGPDNRECGRFDSMEEATRAMACARKGTWLKVVTGDCPDGRTDP